MNGDFASMVWLFIPFQILQPDYFLKFYCDLLCKVREGIALNFYLAIFVNIDIIEMSFPLLVEDCTGASYVY